MVTTAYDVGDLRRLQVTWSDIAGAAADPTAVALHVLEPDGTVVSKTYAGGDVIRGATGVYYYDFSITQAGRHQVRWIATGALQAAEGMEFWARRASA